MQIHHGQIVIGEAVRMNGKGGVASASPPQAIDAEARGFEKRDFLHFARAGNIVNAQAGAELLANGDAIGERVFEITADIAIRLHGDNVCAIGE